MVDYPSHRDFLGLLNSSMIQHYPIIAEYTSLTLNCVVVFLFHVNFCAMCYTLLYISLRKSQFVLVFGLLYGNLFSTPKPPRGMFMSFQYSIDYSVLVLNRIHSDYTYYLVVLKMKNVIVLYHKTIVFNFIYHHRNFVASVCKLGKTFVDNVIYHFLFYFNIYT